MVNIDVALTQMMNSGAVGSVFYWLGYGILALALMGVLGIGYYFISFNYKVWVFPIYGSGKDGVFSVQKPKKNRVKWIKHQTAWRKMFPLFNRKEIEPFDTEFIYPGKTIYAFELNNEWVPGRININKTEDSMRAEINPVPYFVRNWQGLQYKQNAVEYSMPGFWEENKQLIMGVLTVAICLAAMLAAIYFTYKYLAPGRADLAAFTSAIKNANTAPVIGPH